MWIIFVICSGHTLSVRINLSFRINTIFIGIFYGFIMKNCFWKVYIIRNAMICRKIKVSEIYMYRNSFHFRVFVKNLSKYIAILLEHFVAI